MSEQRFWVPENIPRINDTVIHNNVKLSGHFTVELIDHKTGLINTHLEFDNILTDGLFEGIGNGSIILGSAFNALEVGTGQVTGLNSPSSSNTTLVSPLSPRTTNETFSPVVTFVSSSSSGSYWSKIVTREFTETEVNGNLTELGFWTNTSGGTLVNRTSFKDADGSPTIITKTSNFILRVKFENRMYIDVVDVTGSINLGGSLYDYIIRPIGISTTWNSGLFNLFGRWQGYANAYESASLQDVTSSVVPNTVNNSNGNLIYESYVPGEKSLNFIVNFNNNNANFFSGIQYILLNHTFGMNPQESQNPLWQIHFSPKIPKISSNQLSLKLNQSFGRML